MAEEVQENYSASATEASTVAWHKVHHPFGVCSGTDPGGNTGVLEPASGGGTAISSPTVGGRSTPSQFASDSLNFVSGFESAGSWLCRSGKIVRQFFPIQICLRRQR